MLLIQYIVNPSIGDTWEQARKLQDKMRKTAHQIKSRLEALELDLTPYPQQNGGQGQSREERDSSLGRTAVNGD